MIHVLLGGQQRKIKCENGRIWDFEMHPQCGPIATSKRGEILNKQPSDKSPFWSAVQLWVNQGQKIGKDGLCDWVEPVKPKLVHLGGRNYCWADSPLAAGVGKREAKAQEVKL